MLLAGRVVAVVGVSIGTAELEPGREPGAVLEQADARMYSAKSLRTSTAAALPGSRP